MLKTRRRCLLALAVSTSAAALGWASPAHAQVYPPAPILPGDGGAPPIAVTLADFANAPLSGRGGSLASFGPNVSAALTDQFARINFLRPEPASSPVGALGPYTPAYNPDRMFLVDNNRSLSILNKAALDPATPGAGVSAYLNFQSVFPQFDNDPGYAGGLVTMAFDPDYLHNGTFYTVHTENTTPASGSTANWLPTSANLPAASFANYQITPAVRPVAGAEARQAVLVEWHDSNIADAAFSGTARELLRVGFNGNLHPMGDLLFNPTAKPGQADYGNLYISMGDGGSGENNTNDDVVPGITAGDRHNTPQRLDALLGKILRIAPTHNAAGVGSAYTVPADNPFTAASDAVAANRGAKPEIFAYGFRNPHRMSWDPASGAFLVNDIGFYSFEETNVVVKGGNYGWGEREGARMFDPLGAGDAGSTSLPGTKSAPLPGTDTVTQRLSVTIASSSGPGAPVNQTTVTNNPDGTTTSVTTYRATTNGTLTTMTSITRGAVVPRYPVLDYFQSEGDAIASGFVYRGTAMPALVGKYVFGDITTGRLFYADLQEMLSADDGNPATRANVRELLIMANGSYTTVYDLVAAGFALKGGDPDPLHAVNQDGVLPGFAANVGGYHNGVFDPADVAIGPDGQLVYDAANASGLPRAYGGGRADIRLAQGDDGELYVLSKSDGMIRMLSGAVLVPEPGTLASLALGATLLLRRRRLMKP